MRPSAEIVASEELPFPLAPVAPPARLARVMEFVCKDAHEHVAHRIVVGGVEVGRQRVEGDEAPVSGDRGIVGAGVRLGSGVACGPADQVEIAGCRRRGSGYCRQREEAAGKQPMHGLDAMNAGGNATIADGHAVGTITNDDRTVRPHKFTLGEAHPDRKTGTARLAVSVPGPGRLAISGAGVKAAGAATARTVRAAGTMRLLLEASGNKQRTLNRTGTVTITPTVTYTPFGGTPRTRSKNVRLEKR